MNSRRRSRSRFEESWERSCSVGVYSIGGHFSIGLRREGCRTHPARVFIDGLRFPSLWKSECLPSRCHSPAPRVSGSQATSHARRGMPPALRERNAVWRHGDLLWTRALLHRCLQVCGDGVAERPERNL
jgi:hypothetical protein